MILTAPDGSTVTFRRKLSAVYSLGPVAPDRRSDYPPIGPVPEDPEGLGRRRVVAEPEGEGVFGRPLRLELLGNLAEALLGEGRTGAHET